MTRHGSWIAAAMTLAGVEASPPAWAHGPPAAVTGVIAGSDGGPRVVSVSEGLAQLVEGRWRYVCPAPFGTELSPPALSADGHDTFVVGQDDLFVLHADGTITARGESAFSRSFVLNLAVLRGRVHAVRFENGTTSIRPVDDASAAPIFEEARVFDSITPDDEGFWAGWHLGAEGHATRIATDRTARRDVAFALEKGDYVTRVAESAGVLYVAVLTDMLSGKLLRVTGDGSSETVLQAAAPVIGPVTLSGGAGAAGFAVADGTLETLDVAPLAIATADRATCLGVLAGFGYACERTRLFSLETSGPGELLVDLSEIEPPAPSGLAPEVRDQCSLQWLVFQNDLRAVGVLPPPDAGVPGLSADAGASPVASRRATVAGSGCGVGGRSCGGAGAAGLLCVLAWLGRARRRCATR